MDKAKARISQDVDGYWRIAIFYPESVGEVEKSFLFNKHYEIDDVRGFAKGIIDALHEALDEVECDEQS